MPAAQSNSSTTNQVKTSRKSLVRRGLALDQYALDRDAFVRKNVYDPLFGAGSVKPRPKKLKARKN
jgi:hypothetical protein